MTTQDSIPSKHCCKCLAKKPLTEFYRASKNADGFRYNCKECCETPRRKGKPRKFTIIKGHPFLTRVARLFEKIEIDPSIVYKGVPCWLWAGAINADGYSSITMGNKTQDAHRVMYKMFIEENLTTEEQCDHLCRVRRCVNPAHLEIVDNKENQMRGVSFSAVNAKKTHCVNGHPFDERNTYFRKRHPTRRDCRECRRISLAKYYGQMSPQERSDYFRKYAKPK